MLIECYHNYIDINLKIVIIFLMREWYIRFFIKYNKYITAADQMYLVENKVIIS